MIETTNLSRSFGKTKVFQNLVILKIGSKLFDREEILTRWK